MSVNSISPIRRLVLRDSSGDFEAIRVTAQGHQEAQEAVVVGVLELRQSRLKNGHKAIKVPMMRRAPAVWPVARGAQEKLVKVFQSQPRQQGSWSASVKLLSTSAVPKKATTYRKLPMHWILETWALSKTQINAPLEKLGALGHADGASKILCQTKMLTLWEMINNSSQMQQPKLRSSLVKIMKITRRMATRLTEQSKFSPQTRSQSTGSSAL